MKRILTLCLQDVKNIYRDPMLIMSMLAPLILLVILNFFVPWLNLFLIERWNFHLDNYYTLIVSIFLTITPYILGILGGLLILDEKEQNLIMAYVVSPLGKKGYIIYRLLSPVLMSFVFIIVIISFISLIDINVIRCVPIAFMASLQAPIISLFMSSFGSDKVEGLTLSKLIGIVLLLPIADNIFNSAWTKLIGIFPNYWVSYSFMYSSSFPIAYYLMYIGIGLIIHLLYILFLFNRFSKNI